MTQNEILKIESINPNESGRSMVEMLGVLAIIGVLSLAGVEGYKYAIAKYTANELLNGVMKRAVLASNYLMSPANPYQGNCCGFSMELLEEENGVYYDAWCNGADSLAISIDPVSKETCEIIAKNLPERITGHRLNGIGCIVCGGGMITCSTNCGGEMLIPECHEEDNWFEFSFYPDLRNP